MDTGFIRSLQDFGRRSLITHGIMAVTLTVGLLAGLFLEGDIGLVSFVALVNFTAGMWVCQSVHALGNPQYEGILQVVRSDGN